MAKKNKDILVLKTDMHLHSSEDKEDEGRIRYDVFELIDYMSKEGFEIISVTLHNYMFDDKTMSKVIEYAKSKGILLIPGIEKTIEKNHILIYNMKKQDAEKISTYNSLKQTIRKYRKTPLNKAAAHKVKEDKIIMIIAAHPFFPNEVAMGKKFYKYHHLLDGIEYNSFYPKLPFMNFNLKGVSEAKKHNLIILGNTDAHMIEQINHTYTNVYIPVNKLFKYSNIKTNSDFKKFLIKCPNSEYKDISETILREILKGNNQIVTKPIKIMRFLKITARLFP